MPIPHVLYKFYIAAFNFTATLVYVDACVELY